jgi:hypothetical protein
MTYDCRIAPEFIGVAPATLQQWLTDCQNALQALSVGGKAQVVSYAQGDGSKAVTYTPADRGLLERRIRDLASALGLAPRRRAAGVRF